MPLIWKPIPLTYRLFCGIAGGALAFGLISLFSDPSFLARQSAGDIVHLVLTAIGAVLFILAAVLGRFPDISDEWKSGESRNNK